MEAREKEKYKVLFRAVAPGPTQNTFNGKFQSRLKLAPVSSRDELIFSYKLICQENGPLVRRSGSRKEARGRRGGGRPDFEGQCLGRVLKLMKVVVFKRSEN